ncbi:hypothetical protein IAR50_001588 [Cryptococcus sp. DSM 104548]
MPPRSPPRFHIRLFVGVAVIAFLVGQTVSRNKQSLDTPSASAHDHGHVCRHHPSGSKSRTSPVTCPIQPEAFSVGSEWFPGNDVATKATLVEKLAGAIRIRTETFDDMPMNATDPGFDVFCDFEDYLKKTFPLLCKTLEFERVNEHGLLFTWQGTRPDLKPMLLMAHQDVVPVNPSTLHLWKHPPFDAHMDEDGWIWGRGTTDMKATLIALWASAERLIEEGFQPERTIIFSHGFDEEIQGPRGAKELAKVILERYGPQGISIIVDEGFNGVDTEYGTTFARVGTAEKGCLTVTISISTPGGHSSRPSKHTGVGIMSRLIVEMENNPNQPRFLAGNPLLSYLECAAEYGDMDEFLRAQIREKECWPALADELGGDRVLQTFLKTTQAVDIFNGGIKYNALPKSVHAITNYRIDFFETTQDTLDRLDKILRPLAAEYNMSFASFGETPTTEENLIQLDTMGIRLEPAPITPPIGHAWDLMGGTIKHIFPGSVVVPSGMTAFTDTQYFWDVSTHIYRFAPASLELIKNYHTVNERIHVNAYMSTIRFFHKLMRNSVGWQSP